MSVEEEEYQLQEEFEELEGYDEAAEGGPAEGEEEEEQYVSGTQGTYSATAVNEQIFEELVLGPGIAEEVQEAWRVFLNGAESREAAGEAIYAALFDAAPSLQSLFKTPRAIMAMRFMNGLNQIIASLTDPKALKVVVETLGFQHLDLEVTVPRVIIFRDAIADLLMAELGERLTPKARDGFLTFLNYVGGSYIYVRTKFSERLRIIASSWTLATKQAADEADAAGEATGAEGGVEGEGEEGGDFGAGEGAAAAHQAQEAAQTKKAAKKGKGWFGPSSKKSGSGGKGKTDAGNEGQTDDRNNSVPTTYNEMFMFNSAVMGFGNHMWMNEVLSSFDAVVLNVANSYRLQEECDILSLRLAKYKGTINLPQYKAVMLASLRSLVKDWGSQHEVAWSWLWENVERMLKALMGKPAAQEKALSALYSTLDESALMIIRKEVYQQFFAIAPAGQDYFKQSTTRLYFIADKIVGMVLDMYKEPKRMVEDISGLGLRHVGYGIPTDLFGPFVTACVKVVRMLTDDDAAEEAFRWSLNLISRMLTRVINEGSTIVMKAINVNSGKMLKKAVGCAPRGKRALWVLNVQVGTQSISPLMWAIETGSLEAAKAIIIDLLTIRADRDRYYYGMDIMFERHPDILNLLCLDAPALLPVLLDGLIWRSRVTENGQRRVNYYIKHLLVNEHGDFAKNVEWIRDHADPKIVVHPVISMVTDMVWSRVALRTFMFGKAWFLFTLSIFISSQSLLGRVQLDETGNPSDGVRIAIAACRCFIYLCSLGQWLVLHVRNFVRDCRQGSLLRYGRCAMPEYLADWQNAISFILTGLLILMLCLEPILHCLSSQGDKLLTQECAAGKSLKDAYSIISAAAIILFFLLLLDLSVFSTRVAAFVLICTRVMSEVALFLFGLTFFVLAFACAISALEQDSSDFQGIHWSSLQLYKITFGMFSDFDALQDNPALFVSIFIYIITTVVFMLNLLTAQLNCSYQATYEDMVGFARLNRSKIVVDTMPSVPKWRWERFITSMRLDERVEFGEGDIGLAGGIQVWEPASANITTVDLIRRFGGSTSPGAQWPEEEGGGDDDEDRFDKLEKLIEKAVKRMSSRGGGKRGGSNQHSSSIGMSASDSDNKASGSGHESEAGSH